MRERRFSAALLTLAALASPSLSAEECAPNDTACGWSRFLTDEALGHWPMTRHMAADPAGNVYIVGETYPERVRYLRTETLLAKYDHTGKRRWLRRFRAPGADGFNVAYGLAVDGAGNICLGGITDGSYDDPNQPRQRKGFAARYDTSGRRLWAVDRPLEVATMAQDSNGHCYAISANEIAKYGQGGTLLWSHRQRVIDAAVDTDGTLHILSPHSDDSHFTLTTLKQDGQTIRTLELALGTELDWQRHDFTRLVLKARSGNVYLHALLHGEGRQGKSRIETYLARITPEGRLAWERRYGRAAERWDGFDLTLDGAGNAYLSGMSQGLAQDGVRNGFVIKYGADGELKWLRRYRSGHNNGIGSVSTDGHGNLYTAGGSDGGFDGQVVAKGRSSTPFIARNRPRK